MFVLTDVRSDARVIREAATLAAAGHEVTVMARPTDPAASSGDVEIRDGFEIRRVPIPGRIRRAVVRRRTAAAPMLEVSRPRPARTAALLGNVMAGVRWLVRWQFGTTAWASAAARLAPDADVWHGHDVPGLAAAHRAMRRRGGLLVFDAHELFFEAGATARVPGWATVVARRASRRSATAADAIVTAYDALASELAPLARRPVLVVHNCPARWTPPPQPEDLIRLAADIPPDSPVALYHGSFARFRGVDVLVAALGEPGLERVHAVLMGVGRLGDDILAAAARPAVGGRVHVLPPVDPLAVPRWIAGADVGVMALSASTRNHLLTTPNKLFECIAAGVPVVASDFPGMRGVVAGDGAGSLGELCDPESPADVARAIRSIVDAAPGDRAALRARCLEAAHDRWNWELESASLLRLYDDLAASRAA